MLSSCSLVGAIDLEPGSYVTNLKSTWKVLEFDFYIEMYLNLNKISWKLLEFVEKW